MKARLFLWALSGIILLERTNHYTKFLKKMTYSNLVGHTPGFISWIFNNDDEHDAYRHNVMNQNVGAYRHTTNIIVCESKRGGSTQYQKCLTRR